MPRFKFAMKGSNRSPRARDGNGSEPVLYQPPCYLLVDKRKRQEDADWRRVQKEIVRFKFAWPH